MTTPKVLAEFDEFRIVRTSEGLKPKAAIWCKENDFLAIEQRDGVDSMGVTRWISVHPGLVNEPLIQALVNVLLQSHIKIADLEDEIRG